MSRASVVINKKGVITRRGSRWPGFFKVLFVAGLLAAIGYFGYLHWPNFRFPQMATETLEKVATITQKDVSESRDAENAALRQRVAMLERAAQVESKAYEDVDTHLKALQKEILELKEEIVFYQGIVSSDRALDIQSFRVKRGENGKDYHYRVVLTGAMKSDKVVSGSLSLAVAGEQNGRLQQLWLADLSGIEFQFKYFKRIEGRMKLPEGFVPHGVIVEVTASGDAEARVEKTFDWPSPLG